MWYRLIIIVWHVDGNLSSPGEVVDSCFVRKQLQYQLSVLIESPQHDDTMKQRTRSNLQLCTPGQHQSALIFRIQNIKRSKRISKMLYNNDREASAATANVVRAEDSDHFIKTPYFIFRQSLPHFFDVIIFDPSHYAPSSTGSEAAKVSRHTRNVVDIDH